MHTQSITIQEQIHRIREQFPILKQTVNGKPLVYFDNAASSQKPQVVIDAISKYYETINSNVHRGVHKLSQLATDAFEAARKTIQTHINARESGEVILTKGCTESINLVAHGFAWSILRPGDEVLVSALEHHSNIVPWQMACERSGAKLRVIPMDHRGVLDMVTFAAALNARTKLVAVNHISNALGTVNPIAEIIEKAHAVGAAVLIDGAQGAPHTSIDVQSLDVDFYTISGHKAYGPTGVGILYGKREWLEKLPPYQGGGEMIATVTFEKSTYADIPHKFEAGTPNIAGMIGLGAAFTFINETGIATIAAIENALLQYATEKLQEVPGVKIYGTAPEKASVLSFLVEGVHPYDLGTLLDQMGIAVRTGHHCTQPIMDFFDIPGTVRASFACYNTFEEIDTFVAAVKRACAMLL
ncbi:MAG: cysteine desulfurase [Schleiferiaceae bacterium]|nr:cysteine desulfurase [Schleiferiaceae bacterium]